MDGGAIGVSRALLLNVPWWRREIAAAANRRKGADGFPGRVDMAFMRGEASMASVGLGGHASDFSRFFFFFLCKRTPPIGELHLSGAATVPDRLGSSAKESLTREGLAVPLFKIGLARREGFGCDAMRGGEGAPSRA